MTDEIAEIAVALVKNLSPFVPYLVEGGKGFSGKAGEAAWEKAQLIWGKIKARFGDDKKIMTAAKAVAEDPEDDDFQALLAKALTSRLRENKDFANDMFELIGGQETIQMVLAERGSWVEEVLQQTSKKGGLQIVQAQDDSFIQGVRQIKK